ncbi:hypothetical protein JCM10135_13320 [Stetteria hydrogenophila]
MGDPIGPVKDVLAFFAAMRNYGYLDIIGNALEEVTVLEALGNALRDFRSTCIDASAETKARLAREKVVCPNVKPEELENAVNAFIAIMKKRAENGTLVNFLREVYVESLARAGRFKLQEAQARA